MKKRGTRVSISKSNDDLLTQEKQSFSVPRKLKIFAESKRSISAVVTTILLVLLAVVAILIIWFVLRGFIKKSASGLETSCLILDLRIEKAEINISSDILYVKVRRNVGEANLSSIKFIIINRSESMLRDRNISMNELESRSFSFDDVGNVSAISKVEIAGVVSLNNDKKICRISSSKDIFGVYSAIQEPECLVDSDCGVDYCDENWGKNYCGQDGNVYQSKTCHDFGCTAGSCIDNTNIEEQQVRDCSSYGCTDAACQGSQIKYIEPNGDGVTLQWNPSPAGTHYTTIDDEIRQPAEPDRTDFISSSYAKIDEFNMETFNVASVSKITIWAFVGGSNVPGSITIFVDGFWRTDAKTVSYIFGSHWESYSWTRTTETWDQDDLDNLQVRIIGAPSPPYQYGGGVGFAMYGEITYT